MKRLFSFSAAPVAALALLAGAMIGPAAALSAPPMASAGPHFTENGHAVDDADLAFMTDAAVAEYQLAHAGQLSPKDGCHKSKALKERHWHKDGTSERGGPCVGKPGFKLTDHALCAKERIAFARDKDDGWGVNYRAHAERLRDCIVRMKPRPKR